VAASRLAFCFRLIEPPLSLAPDWLVTVLTLIASAAHGEQILVSLTLIPAAGVRSYSSPRLLPVTPLFTALVVVASATPERYLKAMIVRLKP